MENKDFEKDLNTTESNKSDSKDAQVENELMDQEDQREEGVEENKEEVSDSGSTETSEAEKLKKELEEAKDKYLRLYSEFENFRRRTAKERLDLVKTANEDMATAIIPVIDDFERAQKAYENNKEKAESKSTYEGFKLIQNKLVKVMEQKGLKPMEDKVGSEFDPEIHEAITKIPAPEEKLKGKIVDVVEKGYYLNDKVIRFAKVVIGA